MQQVVQNARTGELKAASVPPPLVRPGYVLIANMCSVISAGTEKMVMDLARKSLLGKARQRPDLLRRVMEKVRKEGLIPTMSQVFSKLGEPIGLGYSSAGLVLAVGAGVQGFRPGDRVASNGPHAEVVCVPNHLCAAIPDNVSFEQAAFAVMGAIALQGVRLARLGLGDTVLVIGLGLLGQIAVSLLKAQGCRVLGCDLDESKCRQALTMGADAAAASLDAEQVGKLTGGIGADAVLITAATRSDGPVELAANSVRPKGRVVVVGDVGMRLPRQPLYLKEAELVVSCSYGPGRYDAKYEHGGQDYPVGHVRWTEQRNIQAVLDLMGSARLNVAPLITHRFRIEDAASAYRLIESQREPYLGIVLEYPPPEDRPARGVLELRASKVEGRIGLGCIGAGSFARMVLLPAAAETGKYRLRMLCSAGGLSAVGGAERLGFEAVTTDPRQVLADPAVQAVFIVTRHDLHAAQAAEALRAGKHVFVEKPLAMNQEELAEVESALLQAQKAGRILMVGFNRRFSPAAAMVREFLADAAGPMTVSIRFNAGAIPPGHWTQDGGIGGGRIIGEACHGIDLATFLVASPVVRVFAERVGGPEAPVVTDDQCFITLRHADGSISSVAYLAGGDANLPKERVEVIGGGRAAVIDDFRTVTTCSGGRSRAVRLGRQDKGHRREVEAFAEALAKGSEAPIPWGQLRATTLAAILATQSIREGVPLDIPEGCGAAAEGASGQEAP